MHQCANAKLGAEREGMSPFNRREYAREGASPIENLGDGFDRVKKSRAGSYQLADRLALGQDRDRAAGHIAEFGPLIDPQMTVDRR